MNGRLQTAQSLRIQDGTISHARWYEKDSANQIITKACTTMGRNACGMIPAGLVPTAFTAWQQTALKHPAKPVKQIHFSGLVIVLLEQYSC